MGVVVDAEDEASAVMRRFLRGGGGLIVLFVAIEWVSWADEE